MSVSKRNNNTFFKTRHRLALGTCGRIVSITGKYFLLLVFLMYAAVQQQSHAQVASATAVNTFKPTPLAIGDKIPDELWNLPLQVVNHPQGKKTITLSEYRDKLIILDFWATWCGSCIKELPKLNILQRDFQKDVKFLVIGEEDKFKIADAIKRFKIDAPNLLFISSDITLKKVFPHRFVPHEVWVKEEKIAAISSASEISNSNIIQLLNTGRINIKMKKDLMEFDEKKSLSENVDDLGLTPLYHYESILLKRIDGAGRHGSTTEENGSYRMSFINYPLHQLYRAALGISLKESSKITWKLNADTIIPFDPKTTAYCYEIKSLSSTSIPKLKEVMLSDLNRHFRLRVIKEQQGSEDHYVICNEPSH